VHPSPIPISFTFKGPLSCTLLKISFPCYPLLSGYRTWASVFHTPPTAETSQFLSLLFLGIGGLFSYSCIFEFDGFNSPLLLCILGLLVCRGPLVYGNHVRPLPFRDRVGHGARPTFPSLLSPICNGMGYLTLIIFFNMLISLAV